MRPEQPSGNSTARKGFTLLEMVVTVALIAALAGAGAAAYFAVIQATALDAATQLLGDFFAEARQDAVTQNMTVEVRLYQVPGAIDATPVYREMQLHWLEANGTTPPIRPPLALPASVVLDATAVHSSLIAGNAEAVPTDTGDPLLNKQTRVFHFLSDGSTDLNPAGSWFLTLRAAAQADPTHFPVNWACLTLDPVTGRVQIFRP
jgi:uncharacterized protein (TIGR02596 family)